MRRENAPAAVHSVNVSGPLRSLPFAGQTVTTGFFKRAVDGPARVHRLGMEGDAQGDRSVHGGPEKAVYFYPREHYPAWEERLGSGRLPPGSFGENITSIGLLETDVQIGDILQIGSATLQVIQPRSPCFKLQIRFGRPDMTALFYQRGKPGWYASVLQEGDFAAEDDIVVLDRAQESLAVANIWQYSVQSRVDRSIVERINKLELLPEFWKSRIGRTSST